MKSRSQRNPWPVRIAVGCGGVMMLCFLLVVGLVVWWMAPRRTEMGMCSSTMGTSCTQVPPAKIGALMQMELPPGTVVRESKFESWQDQHLTATVEIPAAGAAQWERSLGAWDGAKLCDLTTSCKEGCPADKCVTQRESGSPQRSYQRHNLPGGAVELKVTYFTM